MRVPDLRWMESELLEIPLKANDEARVLMVSRIEGKYWSAVIIYRKERVRIISARRSRDQERELYES